MGFSVQHSCPQVQAHMSRMVNWPMICTPPPARKREPSCLLAYQAQEMSLNIYPFVLPYFSHVGQSFSMFSFLIEWPTLGDNFSFTPRPILANKSLIFMYSWRRIQISNNLSLTHNRSHIKIAPKLAYINGILLPFFPTIPHMNENWQSKI